MNILEEFTQEYEIIKEDMDRGVRIYKIRGVMGRAEYPNKNRRVYPLDIMKESVDSVQESIRSNRFLGEIDHPDSQKINMDKVSHKIITLSLSEDGIMLGEMIPAGPNKDKLISLIEDKIGFGVSTRGSGSVGPYNGPLGEGLSEVKRGYSLCAIDIVHNPSANAFPNVVREDTQNFFTVPHEFKSIWNEVFKIK